MTDKVNLHPRNWRDLGTDADKAASTSSPEPIAEKPAKKAKAS